LRYSLLFNWLLVAVKVNRQKPSNCVRSNALCHYHNKRLDRDASYIEPRLVLFEVPVIWRLSLRPRGHKSLGWKEVPRHDERSAGLN
jgi:hypothetical protein